MRKDNQPNEDMSEERGFHKYRPMNSVVIVETREFIRHEDFHKMSKEELWLNHVGLGKTEDFYVRNDEVVDTTRSWVEDFGWRDVIDMQYHASQVVVAENSKGRIPEHELVHRWKSYGYAFEEIGLCHECKQPIKPVRSTYGAERRRVQRHGLMTVSGWRLKFDFKHYTYRDYSNLNITDIPSHFEVKWNKKTQSFYYRYIDGTKRDIRIRRIAVKVKKQGRHHWDRFHMDADGMIEKTVWKEEFVEHCKDGSIIPCVPKPSYRVYHAKCRCKFRNRPRKMKVRRA